MKPIVILGTLRRGAMVAAWLCPFVVITTLTGLNASCAPRAVSAPPAQPAPEPPKIVLPTMYVTPTDAGSVTDRFRAAHALLMSGKFDQAAAAFDAIVLLEPGGELAAPSLFNAGFCHEQADDRKSALARYRDLTSRYSDVPEAKLALVRSLHILIHLENWQSLGDTSEALLARRDLTQLERIEALGGRALSLLDKRDHERAAEAISRARSIIEAQRWSEGERLPHGVAMVYFALGEVRRLRGEKLGFVPLPSNFSEVLEQRCQLLLDAQDAYATAMRSYDPHWAAMSGYRVAQLYQVLHRDVMTIPPPSTANTKERRELFEGAMHLRYRVLLDKGLKMLDRTIVMAEKTGEQSAWVARAREAREDLRRSMQQTQQALARLPYSEQDLERALQSLKPAS